MHTWKSNAANGKARFYAAMPKPSVNGLSKISRR